MVEAESAERYFCDATPNMSDRPSCSSVVVIEVNVPPLSPNAERTLNGRVVSIFSAPGP